MAFGEKKILLVGFDSAWAPDRKGAIVGAVLEAGVPRGLGVPLSADFADATSWIREVQATEAPDHTLILLDQPIVVTNPTGQRDVENIVASPVGRRGGGVQPSNASKARYFGDDSPGARFVREFGGVADPRQPLQGTRVFETYPVLTLIALDWTLERDGAHALLPKYNPDRKRAFREDHWLHVCDAAAQELTDLGLHALAAWVVESKALPDKGRQDGVDSCLCLIAALSIVRNGGLMVGDVETGYMVAPYRAELHSELEERCRKTRRDPGEWVRKLNLL